MLDAVDSNKVRLLVSEPHAIVTHAEPLVSIHVLQRSDAPNARLREPVNGREYVPGKVLRNGAHIGFCFIREIDPLQAAESFAPFDDCSSKR